MKELLNELEKMHYSCLGISLTQKCNAFCDMCSVSAGPDCTAKLHAEDVKKIIDTTLETPFLYEICFTGGEVFCAFKEMKELIEYTAAIGKAPVIVTNAYWADSYNKAREIICELKQLGLMGIGLSYDYYHAQYIPVEYVKNAIKAAYHENINYTTNLTCTRNHPYKEMLLQLGECAEISKPNKYYCSQTGRAKGLPKDIFVREVNAKGLRCSEKDRAVAIDFSGNIRPCCSSSIYSTDLSLGKYNNLSILEILTKIKYDPILYIIRNKGFDFFIDIAINKFGINIPEKVTSKCDLCEVLFCSENYGKFKPYAQEYFEKIHCRYIC